MDQPDGKYGTTAKLVWETSHLSSMSRHDGWMVSVAWAPIAGRIEPTDVCVVSEVERPTTADAIRRLPLGEMLAEGRAAIGKMQDLPVEGSTLADAWPTALGGPGVEVGKPQRGQRLTGDDLEQVAEVYLAARRNGEPVNEAVRNAFYLSRDGAAKRIMRARAAGLLDGKGPKR
jgi:hypothetical protein